MSCPLDISVLHNGKGELERNAGKIIAFVLASVHDGVFNGVKACDIRVTTNAEQHHYRGRSPAQMF